MADLMGSGSMPATTNGGNLPAARRPTAAPAPTGSPSGIRGPRMIMQERAAREARQKAEAERLQMERSRAEQESRLQDEAQRKIAERRAAGVAATGGGKTTAHQGQRTETIQAPITSPTTPQPSHQRTNTSNFAANQQLPSQIYGAQSSHRPQAQSQSQTHHQQPQVQQPNLQTQPADAASHVATGSKPRNSFPHAFERWETLSAHWEGLTSYWIRKLEQNKDDLNRDPVSQQLARQVTDLSAAGANLFHAVVELQRLRASSERKFQRWFFETRAELERAREVNAMLETALDQERRSRADAIREAVEQDQGTSLAASIAQKQVAEMRKELAISKDEARRAWEELGRREQAERDRTTSLQSGLPTIVGGVQVVPMTQGMSRRQENYQYEQAQPSEQAQAPVAQASPGPAEGSGSYYRGQQRTGSEGGYSEGEYVTDIRGNFILDVQGNRIPLAVPPSAYSNSDLENTEEYDTPATTNPPSRNPETPATSADKEQWTGSYSVPQDYSGEGYGAPTWETMPRHHHPTRLSDVIEEEDERSRTSASQTGRPNH